MTNKERILDYYKKDTEYMAEDLLNVNYQHLDSKVITTIYTTDGSIFHDVDEATNYEIKWLNEESTI